MAHSSQLPDKLFFKIGEVADIVGVKAHVLRYWEQEFRQLKPMKTRGSHRVYRRQDVETAMLIRRLVHDEGFTIPGAKKRIRELQKEGASEPRAEAKRETELRADLLRIRADLQDFVSRLDDLPLPVEPGLETSPAKEKEPALATVRAH